MHTFDLAAIQLARESISNMVRRTPLIPSVTLSERLGTNVYLKIEVFQKTGSFKVRGAFNRALALTEAERSTGIVAVSGGNHAQAVAYVSRALGLRSLILMPSNSPRNYVEATQGYGAEVRLVGDVHEAFAAAREYQSQGWAFIHPFDDPMVMAGQGTLGLEIVEDLPNVTDVFVSIGGGGLLGGVATAIKSLKPSVRMWGVETEGANCMSLAFAAGHPVTVDKITSIAKTLGAPSASETTFALAKKYLESLIVVSDAEALAMLRLILERVKILTEPAAACTLAAADRIKSRFTPDNHVVLVLCGGNFGLDDLCR
ncbi:MAG: threonine/serine dehydratase [Bryobacteraceae bacterium]